jgi:hypothetical protein
MAFEFDPDVMFKLCAMYLFKGLRIVRVHGILPDGTCTCGKAGCTPGKHPIDQKWATKYARDEDDVLRWLESPLPFNVGVVLGPQGGVIDSEDDDIRAKVFRESIGMSDLVTPTWTSGKSTHQLTQWDDRLQGDTGVVHPGGLEVRTGAGKKMTQSVLPPSWHYSGAQYRWKPGLSPDEVPVAETPRELIAVIYNGAGEKKTLDPPKNYTEPPATNFVFGDVRQGGRHRAILRFVWWKCITTRNPNHAKQRSVLIREVTRWNEENCKPPEEESAVLKIITDCLDSYRKKEIAGWTPSDVDEEDEAIEREAASIEEAVKKKELSGFSVSARRGYELHGLQKVTHGKVETYAEGNWSIEMIHSDPPEVCLIVPMWRDRPCRGRINMTLETFRSPNKVAALVFSATRGVLLDGDSKKWTSIWKGYDASSKTGGESIPGLMERLLEKKESQGTDITVGTSSLRYAQLAGFVLQVFRRATKPRDETKPEPNESGRPCWVTPEELWFQWGKIWDDIGRSHDVVPGERSRVRSRMLAMVRGDDGKAVTDFVHRRHSFATGRLEFVVFTKPWLDALESLAAGEETIVRDTTLSSSDAEDPPESEEAAA